VDIPGTISSLDVVHEDKGEVDTVGRISEIITASPVECTRPSDGRVKVIEPRQGVEEELVDRVVSSLSPSKSASFSEGGSVFLSTGPRDTDSCSHEEAPR
jgi:hypothetical protein